MIACCPPLNDSLKATHEVTAEQSKPEEGSLVEHSTEDFLVFGEGTCPQKVKNVLEHFSVAIKVECAIIVCSNGREVAAKRGKYGEAITREYLCRCFKAFSSNVEPVPFLLCLVI